MPTRWPPHSPMSSLDMSLRTLFEAPDGVPHQMVMPGGAEPGWEVIDAGDWSVGQLREAIDEISRHAFDLSAEIPLKAALFRVTDNEHALVVVVHHIAADGWSIAPLMADLGTAYTSRCAGEAPAWADLPVQYADYSLWQRAQFGELQDSDSPIARQLRYWHGALAGLPERITLPTDRPYPLAADQRGATIAVNWPVELQRQIAELAAENNATSFMVVQAALLILLSRLSANSDVAVGFPIAGRRDPALDQLVGFSLILWCCGPISPVTPRSARFSSRCACAAWRPLIIKTCLSRCSSIG